MQKCEGVLVSIDGLVFMLGFGGGKWYLPAPLFLEGCPCHPCLSGPCSEVIKSLFLPCAPGDSSSLCGLSSAKVCFLPFSNPVATSPPQMAVARFAPHYISTLLTLFGVASFLPLIMEFVMPVFRYVFWVICTDVIVI